MDLAKPFRLYAASSPMSMGLISCGLLMSVVASFAAEAPKPLMAYVGTYSSPLQNMRATQVDLPPGNGRGIHLYQVNRSTGELTASGIYEQGTSPSCLAFDASRTHLYSANETERVGDNESGTISAFEINATDGQLKLMNTVSSGGKGPAYLSVHPSGKFVMVANYFGGTVAILPILPDGRLGEASDVKKDAGTVGPKTATNAPKGSFAFSGHDQTHAHMIEADPSGKYVFHAELGLDKIFIWKLDTSTGILTPNEPSSVSLPAGDGPRHFVFHPTSPWFYSLQEEGSNIVLFDYDNAKGSLKARQTISSLPPGFEGSSFASEIMLSPNGKFLYAGNRLHDSIGIFAIGEDGTLTYLTEEWSHGNYPRSFTLDPSGTFLYCCNQRGDNLACFRLDQSTGKLTFTGHYTGVGNPSIIVFCDLAKSSK